MALAYILVFPFPVRLFLLLEFLMFQVTWLQAGKVQSLSSPARAAIFTAYTALRRAGLCARCWHMSEQTGKLSSLVFPG